jgi:hypothetical protein
MAAPKSFATTTFPIARVSDLRIYNAAKGLAEQAKVDLEAQGVPTPDRREG